VSSAGPRRRRRVLLWRRCELAWARLGAQGGGRGVVSGWRGGVAGSLGGRSSSLGVPATRRSAGGAGPIWAVQGRGRGVVLQATRSGWWRPRVRAQAWRPAPAPLLPEGLRWPELLLRYRGVPACFGETISVSSWCAGQSTVVVDVLLLVDKLLAAVAVCVIARLRFVRVRCSARVKTLLGSAIADHGDTCGWHFLLGGVFLGRAAPPPCARGNPRSACRTGQRRRFSVVPFLKALCWPRRLSGLSEMWPRRFPARLGCAVSAAAGSGLWDAMYAIVRTLMSTPFVRLDPAICSLCAASLGV
jgi:hypothetical protein